VVDDHVGELEPAAGAECDLLDAECSVQGCLCRFSEPEDGCPVVDAGGVGVDPLGPPPQAHPGWVGKRLVL
jgi:hypothetical protein